MIIKKFANTIFLFTVLLLLTSCNADRTASSIPSAWLSAATVPFSGYICAYETVDIEESGATFLQIPLVYPTTTSLSLEDVSEIFLCNENEKFACVDWILVGETNEFDYNMDTLQFLVDIPVAGIYSLNKLEIKLSDGSVTDKMLGDIIFNVRPFSEKLTVDDLTLRGTSGFTRNYTSYWFEYLNNTDQDIIIEGISFDERYYAGIDTIELYEDIEMKKPIAESNIIPAHQNCTIKVTLAAKESKEDIFYFFSPFLNYSVNGEQRVMTAVYSPIVVQTKFHEGYLSSLLEAVDVSSTSQFFKK